jgi:hypothetical protein
MSDFDATPVDEEASDLLDDNATAVDDRAQAGDPAVAERVRQFASLQAAIADVEPPPAAVRERLVAAALAAAPASNVVSLRRRPILATGAGLVAAAAAASLIFVVASRHNETRLSSTAATTAAATAGGVPQVKAADSAATAAASEAATGDFAAATTAAPASTAAAAAAPTTAFASALADRSYNAPQELVSAYQAARDSVPPPSPTKLVSPACVFAGDFVGSITYQDTPADVFVTTDSFGRAHLTALAIEDCHRVIEVTVP